MDPIFGVYQDVMQSSSDSNPRRDSESTSIDGARFSQLIIQAQRRMRTLVLAIAPGCRDVDDILQESCAAMWNKIDEYDASREFDQWALAFVRLQTLAWLKRQGRDRLQLSGDSIESLCRAIDQQDAKKYDQRRIHALEDCLALLTHSEQSLLAQRYIEGAPVADIAQQKAGRTSAALYKTFSRLQSRLLRCIEGKLKESN